MSRTAVCSLVPQGSGFRRGTWISSATGSVALLLAAGALPLATPAPLAAQTPAVVGSWDLHGTGRYRKSTLSPGSATRQKDRIQVCFVLRLQVDNSFLLETAAGETFAGGTWAQKNSRIALEFGASHIPTDPVSGLMGGLPRPAGTSSLDVRKFRFKCKVKTAKDGTTQLFFKYKFDFSAADASSSYRFVGKMKGDTLHRGSGSNTATVTWNPPKKNEDGSNMDDLAGHTIYYGKVGEAPTTIQIIGAGTNEHTIGNMEAGATYYFYVTASDIAGNESGPSTTAFMCYP